jgi:hypothetical protein
MEFMTIGRRVRAASTLPLLIARDRTSFPDADACLLAEQSPRERRLGLLLRVEQLG